MLCLCGREVSDRVVRNDLSKLKCNRCNHFMHSKCYGVLTQEEFDLMKADISCAICVNRRKSVAYTPSESLIDLDNDCEVVIDSDLKLSTPDGTPKTDIVGLNQALITVNTLRLNNIAAGMGDCDIVVGSALNCIPTVVDTLSENNSPSVANNIVCDANSSGFVVDSHNNNLITSDSTVANALPNDSGAANNESVVVEKVIATDLTCNLPTVGNRSRSDTLSSLNENSGSALVTNGKLSVSLEMIFNELCSLRKENRLLINTVAELKSIVCTLHNNVPAASKGAIPKTTNSKRQNSKKNVINNSPANHSPVNIKANVVLGNNAKANTTEFSKEPTATSRLHNTSANPGTNTLNSKNNAIVVDTNKSSNICKTTELMNSNNNAIDLNNNNNDARDDIVNASNVNADQVHRQISPLSYATTLRSALMKSSLCP